MSLQYSINDSALSIRNGDERLISASPFLLQPHFQGQ